MTDTRISRYEAPVSVYLLAEHLDAALAAGEDLTSVLFIWSGPPPREAERIAELRAGQREAIERIRTFELALLSRILKGREWAAEVAESEENFAFMAKLYLSGTAILLDAVAECADVSGTDFDAGDSLIGYVRSRGMIAADAPTLSDTAPLCASEDFLVAKRIPLGPLLDLVAKFLDTLEAEYELFFRFEKQGETATFDLPAFLLR
ncbi:hypothetical protein APY04_1843 [Hyphomicrobium sulfonivorans]|uniref:Uncharacterized protein n=1 Tax=Hyphomicrobium sulfonivorans TaxID=121290 RepID=A0A109BGI0_HYPSL|nr:hypothetical protein [Hyphomicrobium sulfonivorans]KWT68393.1 hypothetical protein APY04_1843 [Hyphomicrobium sulfonivorans]